MTSRALDHLVLPTASLDAARERLTRMGFTVAPEGVHPFGTANACVYFPGGSFLEALALRDAAAAAEAISHGNVFVARDHVFRAMRGEEGLSAVVLASEDADRDHAMFAAADISGGDLLAFSRQSADAAGRAGTASFRLAFAADVETADAFLFTCQRVDVPSIDRSSLETHANGVTGIREIIVDAKAASFLRVAERATGGTGEEVPAKVELSNALLRLATRDDPAPVGETGSTLAAIVFCVDDLAQAAAALRTGGIVHSAEASGLVVPPAPGQGAIFIFRSAN